MEHTVETPGLAGVLVRQPNVESTDAAQLPAVGEEVALSWTHHMARIIVDRR